MTKDDPPRAFLPPEYGGDPKRNRHRFIDPTDLGTIPLDLDDVPQVGGRVLGDALKAGGLAIPVTGGSPPHGLGGLFPPLRRRPEWISDNDVIPSRVEIFQRFRIALHEGIQSQMILLDKCR